MNRLLKFLKDEEGAALVEFGIVAAAVAALIVAAIVFLLQRQNATSGN